MDDEVEKITPKRKKQKIRKKLSKSKHGRTKPLPKIEA